MIHFIVQNLALFAPEMLLQVKLASKFRLIFSEMALMFLYIQGRRGGAYPSCQQAKVRDTPDKSSVHHRTNTETNKTNNHAHSLLRSF